MRYNITTPLAGVNGMHAGINFTNGTAVIDDTVKEEAAALAYFQGAGYGVAEIDDKPKRRRAATTAEDAPVATGAATENTGNEQQGGTQ